MSAVLAACIDGAFSSAEQPREGCVAVSVPVTSLGNLSDSTACLLNCATFSRSIPIDENATARLRATVPAALCSRSPAPVRSGRALSRDECTDAVSGAALSQSRPRVRRHLVDAALHIDGVPLGMHADGDVDTGAPSENTGAGSNRVSAHDVGAASRLDPRCQYDAYSGVFTRRCTF